jgi:hypothetical protein
MLSHWQPNAITKAVVSCAAEWHGLSDALAAGAAVHDSPFAIRIGLSCMPIRE